MHVLGYGVPEHGKPLVPVRFNRETLRPGEVAIDITHSGPCHFDPHQIDKDWGNTNHPCVPGHEIAGHVAEVGDGVSKLAVGDRV